MDARERPGIRPAVRPSSAFTLIELLVVVAIIALLVAILIPALNQARESANATICMTHQKSLGLAFLFYAEDNSRSFPWYGFQSDPQVPPRPAWSKSLVPYLDGPATTGAIVYSEDFPLLFCPSKRKDDEKTYPYSSPWYIDYGYNYQHIGSSYYYDGFDYETPPAKIDQIAKPAETLAVTDAYTASVPTRGAYLVYPNNSNWPAEARHNSGLNILWGDSHVSYVPCSDPDNPYLTLGTGMLGDLGHIDCIWDRY